MRQGLGLGAVVAAHQGAGHGDPRRRTSGHVIAQAGSGRSGCRLREFGEGFSQRSVGHRPRFRRVPAHNTGTDHGQRRQDGDGTLQARKPRTVPSRPGDVHVMCVSMWRITASYTAVRSAASSTGGLAWVGTTPGRVLVW